MAADSVDLLDGKQVLVVEDERLIALYNQDLLEGWGCRVLGPVASVAEALELLETERPDVAVLDFELRGETSEPIAEALSKANRPFLVTTGYERHQLGPYSASTSMLGKPVDEKELRKALVGLFNA